MSEDNERSKRLEILQAFLMAEERQIVEDAASIWDDSKVLVSVEGVRYFLESRCEEEGRELSEAEVQRFAKFLDIDVYDWMKENYRCFLE
jgi:hypothetical protein